MVSNLSLRETDGEDYRSKYRRLKHRLKYLIYENENFQVILKQAQQKYLSAKRDRSFLLDRLIQYEQPNSHSSDSNPSDSSEEEEKVKQEPMKRKRSEGSSGSQPAAKKRKRLPASTAAKQPVTKKLNPANSSTMSPMLSEGQLTPEEVERHLQSRQSFMELLPCRAPPTVPSELFSNDPSLDSFCFSESNEMELVETSPDMGDESYGVDIPDVAD
ncbi:INO80 complex subunit E isoform X2 [Neocloeon triangulifer]|uniref:INO80 complex subunit E isoform X2 n=1 Tax=Neocloeon triangulifer TaxID=2078957 RepID=UPI00286EBD8D|nr:INO80 complex subunit E isoform X2 [Neocloeon triangulifer]